MSDKNFKIKNGLDANGAVTITQPDTSTTPLTIFANTLATGSDLFQVKRPDGTVRFAIGNDGAVDASGSITAVDLTLSGNLTVNGTTTNLNSTNLVIEDKNIILADVTTPTDTTADGAGITIKGATDKTIAWSNTTKAFESSDPFKITTPTASVVPLIVKGAVSQTAALQEWQDSSGTILSNVNSVGAANFVRLGVGGVTPSTVPLFVTSPNASYIASIVRGASGQYANLTEWQDSAGGLIASVTSNGSASFYRNVTIGGGTIDTSARVVMSGGASTDIKTIVRGVASQTADLQQWQNSSGTTLGMFNAYGTFTANNRIYAGWAAFGSGYGTSAAAGNVVLIAKGVSGQTANLTEWQDSAGSALTHVASSGTIYTASGRFATSNGGGTARLDIGASSATNIVASFRGVSSQTANLTEWQDSAGTVLAKIDASGNMTLSGPSGQVSLSVGTNGNSQLNAAGIAGIGGASSGYHQLNVYSGTDSRVGIRVVGQSSQTGDLQQWTNSSGAVLAKVASDGTLLLNHGDNNSAALGYHQLAFGYSGDLTSDGTYKHYIRTKHNASSTSNSIDFYTSDGTRLGTYPTNAVFGLGIENGGITTPKQNINISSASTVGLTIKGAASQTGNLTEWQNSAGTVLGQIDSGGNLNVLNRIVYTGQLYVGTGNYLGASMHNIAGNAGEMRLLLRAHASQTASIQEWQTSGGTTLAKVDANGNFSAISKSFDIPHPTKENMRLRYASLEGPENGVYIRGTAITNIIELPDYWTELVNEDSITVSLTSVGSAQNIYVEKIENNKVYIGGELEKAFFTVYGERKDIDKLTVEY